MRWRYRGMWTRNVHERIGNSRAVRKFKTVCVFCFCHVPYRGAEVVHAASGGVVVRGDGPLVQANPHAQAAEPVGPVHQGKPHFFAQGRDGRLHGLVPPCGGASLGRRRTEEGALLRSRRCRRRTRAHQPSWPRRIVQSQLNVGRAASGVQRSAKGCHKGVAFGFHLHANVCWTWFEPK